MQAALHRECGRGRHLVLADGTFEVVLACAQGAGRPDICQVTYAKLSPAHMAPKLSGIEAAMLQGLMPVHIVL